MKAEFVERRSPVSAWGQVMRDIRNKIERGVLAPGEQLLSETDLAESYGVSRITVRQAMGALSAENYIERRHGSGTFVSAQIQRVQHDLGLTTPWRDRLNATGAVATSETIEVRPECPVPDDLLRDLGLDQSEAFSFASYFKRIQFVDGQPIGLSESWIPRGVAAGIVDEPLTDNSVTITLKSRYGLSAVATNRLLDVAVSSTEDARLLETHMDVPLIVVLAADYDDQPTVIEVSRTMWLGGRVRFQVSKGPDPVP